MGMKNVDWFGYRICAWAIAGLLATLAIYSWISQGWQNGLVLGSFAVSLLLYLGLQRDAPAVFNAVLTASVAMNACGWAWKIFHPIWGYDEVSHALGTLGMTLIFAWYGYRPIAAVLRSHAWVMVLAVAALGVALGAWWEIAEWAGYWLFAEPSVPGMQDEISDLAADSIGAIIAAAFFRWALIQRVPDSACS